MKTAFALFLIMALMVSGCGVNKGYVQEQIKQSESRTGAQMATLRDKTDGNATQIQNLQSLATQLSDKTDMALNQAKGFETYQVIWSGEISYDFDSWDVNATAEQILMEAGEKMEEFPGSVVEFAGHTDRTGSAKYNAMLGEQRAKAGKTFLADRFGISLYRMFTVSFGENKPVAMPDERHAASKNRRVSIKIWANQ